MEGHDCLAIDLAVWRGLHCHRELWSGTVFVCCFWRNKRLEWRAYATGSESVVLKLCNTRLIGSLMVLFLTRQVDNTAATS